jgi:hypothetical protein
MKFSFNIYAMRILALSFSVGITGILSVPARAGTLPTPASSYLPASQAVGSSLSLKANAIVKAAVSMPSTSSTTNANSTIVVVLGTSGPWNEAENPEYTYGTHDEGGPTVFPVTTGESLTLNYVSGTVSAGLGWPNESAEGNTNVLANNLTGSSKQIFPSLYMSPYPIYLDELVGVFTDSYGIIVGDGPFSVGNGPTTVTAPDGATQLQLGVNDDVYHDNVGAYTVQISSSALDLSAVAPVISQPGAIVNPIDSLLQVAPGVAIQVNVPISGTGFNSPETRSTTVTLQAGSQPLQSQTISLADIQSGAVSSIPFTVTFDSSLAGTTLTITATIDAGNPLNETNFSNNTSSVSIDVISCTALIDNALQGPSVENTTEITASFSPNFGYSLLDAAKICGYLNFDWQQTITNLPAPSPFFQASTVMNLVAPPSFLDPPPSGYTYQPQPDNSYPFYYDPSGDLLVNETDTTLQFFDDPADPCLFGGSGSLCSGKTAPPGGVFAFTTHLVGVNPDGSATDLGIGFDWYTTFNGTSGGIATTKNANPPDKGSGSGGVTIVDVQKIYSPTTNKSTPSTLTS